MLEVLRRSLLIQSASREPKPSILIQDMVKGSAVQFDSTDDFDMEDEEDEDGESSQERVLRHNLVNVDRNIMRSSERDYEDGTDGLARDCLSFGPQFLLLAQTQICNTPKHSKMWSSSFLQFSSLRSLRGETCEPSS